MNGFVPDFGYAVRQLRKSPGFTMTAVLTLGLAIGLSTVVFSVIDAMLIRPLPYDHPDRIAFLQTWSPQGYTQPASYPEYRDWRRDNQGFSALAAFNDFGSANLEGPSGPLAVPKVMGSDNFFDVFEIPTYLGRTFAPGEDQPGKNDVAVLSFELWQQQFGSQASAVGQTIKLDGSPYTVIGVMPAGFRFPINLRDAIYIPLRMPKQLAEARQSHWLPTIARLRNNVSREQAQADMNRVLNNIGKIFPESNGRQMLVINIGESIVGNSRAPLQALVFAVLALLAIGCVNIAGLLLARGVQREKEFALRTAIGAGRLRIVRQMLTESFLLACLGAVAGAILAYCVLQAVRTLLIAALARGAEIHLDLTALTVALTLAFLTNLAAGLGPALRLSGIAPLSALKSGGNTGVNRAQHRLRSGFIVAQMALTLVLLVTSGLLLRVLAGLKGADLGLDPDRLLTFGINLSPAAYEGRDAFENFYRPLLEKTQGIPGVKSAGLIQVLPIQNWGWNGAMRIVGHPPSPPNQEQLAEIRFVSPSYFATMGIPLVRGRLLDDRIDSRTSQPVVVVNEAFVKKFLDSGEDPIGKYVEGGIGKLMIVGVVRSIRQDIYEPPLAEMDFSISQVPPQDLMEAVPNMSLVVRTAVEPESIVPDLRRTFHELDPGLPFRQPLSMRQVVADVLVFERLENWLFGTFAALAVLLATVGLYGLISQEVELSTKDIGVRMALGATRVAVLGSVYRRVGLMLSGGVLAGLLLTMAVRKLIGAVVTIENAKDAGAICALAAGLFVIGIAAVFVPAKRAASVDPMTALRYE